MATKTSLRSDRAKPRPLGIFDLQEKICVWAPSLGLKLNGMIIIRNISLKCFKSLVEVAIENSLNPH